METKAKIFLGLWILFLIATVVLAVLYGLGVGQNDDDGTKIDNNEPIEQLGQEFEFASGTKVITFNVDSTEGNLRYNIGDMLNMPFYRTNCNWNLRDFHTLALNFPLSIMWFYYIIQDVQQTVTSHDRLPSIASIPQHVRKAVGLYEKYHPDRKSLNRLLSFCKPNILCIHVRSGDYGIAERRYMDIIKDLAPKYETCVILTGVHNGLDTKEVMVENVNESITQILEHVGVELAARFEICPGTADEHLYLMSKCENLLLHKGGFSMLGALLFSGQKVFRTFAFFETGNKWEEALQSVNVHLEKI